MRLGTVYTEGGSMLTVYVERGKVVLEYPCDSHRPARRKLTAREARELGDYLLAGAAVKLEAR